MTTTKMGVMDAILARHSVRAFTDTPLTEAEIVALLEAARLAPSSLNSQPWRYKVVVDAADKAFFATSQATRSQGFLAGAAAIFVCCADVAGYVRDSQAAAFFYRDNKIIEGDTMDGIVAYVAHEESAPDMARFGAAAMNVGLANAFLMLRAVEMGLGVCWVGMFNEAAIKERFGIAPALRVVNLLAVGHPAPGDPGEHRRKPLADIRL
jgi:nitroreductase